MGEERLLLPRISVDGFEIEEFTQNNGGEEILQLVARASTAVLAVNDLGVVVRLWHLH